MKRMMILLTGIVLLCSCSLRQREIEIERKTAELSEREQQLALKEQSLEFRELQLNEREQLLDSTTKNTTDSLFLRYQNLPGTWQVQMQCTETNCPGSAVGDTKNEQWDFKFQENLIIATAMSNNELSRLYAGTFSGNGLRLSVQQDTTKTSARIMVRLQKTNEKEMEGEREIIQASGCRILYSLRLKKQ